MDTTIIDDEDKYVWKITGTTVIDDTYVEEELKKEAEAFCEGRNTGFALRGLCGQNVSKIDMSNLSPEMFKKLTFDSETIFSSEQKEKFHPDAIREQGKQFGNIGESKINGSGTTIAIIDRFANISEEQFEGRTITVYKVSENGVELMQPEKGIFLKTTSVKDEDGLENGYHGNTIASLTVGKECGVAPNANVILFHIDGIDSQKAQDKVLEFIDKNKEEFTIPDILSVSASTKIDSETLKELKELGCAFINSDVFMKDFTWGRSSDGQELVRDEFIQYTIDAFRTKTGQDIGKKFDKNKLIPVIGRTSSYINSDGEEVEKYNGSFCGNSFAICQAAGLFLLARQIQPKISYDEFIETIKKSQKENSEHRMYVDPKDVIEKIQQVEINKENRKSDAFFEDESRGVNTIPTQQLGKQTKEEQENTEEKQVTENEMSRGIIQLESEQEKNTKG